MHDNGKFKQKHFIVPTQWLLLCISSPINAIFYKLAILDLRFAQTRAVLLRLIERSASLYKAIFQRQQWIVDVISSSIVVGSATGLVCLHSSEEDRCWRKDILKKHWTLPATPRRAPKSLVHSNMRSHLIILLQIQCRFSDSSPHEQITDKNWNKSTSSNQGSWKNLIFRPSNANLILHIDGRRPDQGKWCSTTFHKNDENHRGVWLEKASSFHWAAYKAIFQRWHCTIQGLVLEILVQTKITKNSDDPL